MDVVDAGHEYCLALEVPGARRDGVEVKPGPVPGTLDVRVEGRSEPNEQALLRAERGARGGVVRFHRIVPVGLDADTDKVRTDVSEGILTLTVPKRHASAPEKTKKSRD